MIRLSSADTETKPAEGEEEVVETDERREARLAEIAEILGDALLESHIEPGRELFIRVDPAQWKTVHLRLRDDLGFKFFEFLSAIDWLPSPYGKSEDSATDAGVSVTTVDEPGEIEQGHAGGETRFQVFTRVVDITDPQSLGVVVKADIADSDGVPGSVETLIAVYPGANWHEREIHEMFGISFDGHPYLMPLYLPTGFEGNPLRKDFPLLARHVKPWPGIVDVEPMPDEDDSGEDSDEDSEGGDES